MLKRMRAWFAAATPQQAAASGFDATRGVGEAFDAYQRGDLHAARAALDRVLARAPDDPDALQLLAAVNIADGQPGAAHRLLTRASEIAPGNFELHVARAQAAAMAGDHAGALASYLTAIELRPRFVALYAVAAETCERLHRVDEAMRLYRRSIEIEPRFGAGWLNLGRLLHEAARWDEASECFERLLAVEPDNAKAHFNRALALERTQDLAQAEATYRRALELDATLQQARFNLGVVLYQLGRHDEAGREFEHCAPAPAEPSAPDANAVDAQVALTQFNLALVRLGRGQLAEGWALFDRRFDVGRHAVTRRPHAQPLWRGEPLCGRHLLVWGEQGVGDELLYASLFGDLPHEDGRISIECRPKLASLFARSFPWARVVCAANPPAQQLEVGVDVQIPAGSLARLYRTSLERFPERRAYLLADERRSLYWRKRLGALGPGLKIGFCWRSSNIAGHRALSCPRLDEWQALFAVPGVQWICLQYDECAEELAVAAERFGVTLHRFGEIDHFDDLDEVAALMSALDLVISAPTTVSIQAAALGIETWQMSYGTDWQTHGTDRNPWLPAITRYPRRWDQAWRDVMAELARRLRERAAAHALADRS